MGPDGALYAVDTGSTVTQMVRRAPVRFRSKLQGSPQELYATMTGALLARVGEKAPVLEVLGSDQAAGVHHAARRGRWRPPSTAT